MIQRGRARRTISAGSWFGQWSPDPPVLCDRSSPSPRPLARHVETSAQPNGGSRRPSPNEFPDRRRVTWKPPVGRTAVVGRPCPNQRNKSERKGNMRQPQLCSMPASPSHAVSFLRKTDRAARHEEVLVARSGRPAQPVEPKEGIFLLGSIERLEEFGVRIGPQPFDGESFRVGDIVRSLAGICSGHDQKLDLLGLEVG